MENTKKPALRFKGFTSAWEQRRVKELASTAYGGGTPSTANADFWSGTIPWIQSSDLAEHQVSGVVAKKHISKAAIMNSATKLVPENSLAIITRVGVGKLAVMPFSYATSQDFLSLSELKTDINFTAYLLYKKLQSELNSVQGTSIKGITKDELLAKIVTIPEGKEQTQIGAFFARLDTLITLHQRKCDKLQNVKKSMLEKMFPKNGSNVPEIRFKGFTDAWEQRKLGEFCEKFTDGDWIESKDQSDSGVRLVQTGNIGVTEYLDKPSNMKWISQATFDRLHCKEVLPGDLLISRLPEPAGRACIMPFLGTKMITAVDCTIVRTSANYNSKFLVQFLSSQEYFNTVNTALAGGTRQRISRSILASFVVSVPQSFDEQTQIGAFFAQLDTLITLHQRKLEKLKNIKKSCLEKMFI